MQFSNRKGNLNKVEDYWRWRGCWWLSSKQLRRRQIWQRASDDVSSKAPEVSGRELDIEIDAYERGNAKYMESKLRRLRKEMQEIGAEQRSIREGQRQVIEKFEAIEAECQMLKRETRIVLQQSARNKIRLAIMFRIFKARREGDCAKATELTRLLREMVVRDNNMLMRAPASDE